MDSSEQKEHSNTFLNVLDPKSLQPDDSFGENVILSNDSEVQSKKSHRVLYFSDGTLEYDTDEDELDEANQNDNIIDPKTLTWGPWMLHYLLTAGMKTLGACDYVGESLANFFGITTPKYQYEIEEFYRMKAEEEEIKQKEDLEMGGWIQKQTDGSDVVHTSVNEQATSSHLSFQQGIQDNLSEVDRERNNQKKDANEDDISDEAVKLLL